MSPFVVAGPEPAPLCSGAYSGAGYGRPVPSVTILHVGLGFSAQVIDLPHRRLFRIALQTVPGRERTRGIVGLEPACARFFARLWRQDSGSLPSFDGVGINLEFKYVVA